MFYCFLNKWLEVSVLKTVCYFCVSTSLLELPCRVKLKVGREAVDFTALRPACSAAQDDALAYTVMIGRVLLLRQMIAENGQLPSKGRSVEF